MYNIGGWIIIPGSCKSGLRSDPLAAAGNILRNGFEVTRVNKIVPKLINPKTPKVLAKIGSVKFFEKKATALLHKANIKPQSRIDPS
jgi:hypothetical protein